MNTKEIYKDLCDTLIAHRRQENFLRKPIEDRRYEVTSKQLDAVQKSIKGTRLFGYDLFTTLESTGLEGAPFLDALGHEIDFGHIILWLRPVFTVVGQEVPVGYKPHPVIQHERMCSMGEGTWEITASELNTVHYYTFTGLYGEPNEELYSLNMSALEHYAKIEGN